MLSAMKTQTIGQTSLVSTRLVYGCMKVSGGGLPENVTREQIDSGKASIAAAYEAGFTHFDTADIYGRGACDSILGEALRDIAGMRDRVIVTTKCGIRRAGEPSPDSPHRYDFSAEYIAWSCDQALKRLGIDTIDLYLLHRPDVLMNPQEVAKAFDAIHKAGKVRYFGVSNFTPSQLSALQTYLPEPLAVNQVRIHFDSLFTIEDGTLNQCIERRITPEAYSPVGRGMFATGGTVPEANPRREVLEKLIALLDETAAAHGTNRTCITLAWLLKHPAGILPIIGTVRPDRIREAAGATDVHLSREEWYRIYIAARGASLP